MKFGFDLGDVHVDGVSAIRRFVAQNRVVVTFTSLLTPLGSGLLFRENGWFVISDTSGSPTLSPTLFQTFYRMHMEKADSVAAISPRTAHLHKLMMSNQSEKMRSYLLKLQNMLLYEFNSIAAGERRGDCSLQIESSA